MFRMCSVGSRVEQNDRSQRFRDLKINQEKASHLKNTVAKNPRNNTQLQCSLGLFERSNIWATGIPEEKKKKNEVGKDLTKKRSWKFPEYSDRLVQDIQENLKQCTFKIIPQYIIKKGCRKTI